MNTLRTSTKIFTVIGLMTLGAAGHAQFTTYNPTNTDWQTVANVRIDPTVANGASFNSITGGGHTINFGVNAIAGVIGDTQAVWGSSAISELADGAFVSQFSGSGIYTFTFSSAVSAFGFEGLGDDLFDPQSMSVDFYNGTNLLGSIGHIFDNSNVFANNDLYGGDVYLFGASDSRGFTSVKVNYSGTGFTSGAFRVGALAGGGNGGGGNGGGVGAVPEPGEWAVMGLLSSGLGGLVLRARRRKSA
jgi:hypothetical protein